MSVLRDSRGTLWIASYRGLLEISGQEETLYTTRDGLPTNQVRLKLNVGKRSDKSRDFRDTTLETVQEPPWQDASLTSQFGQELAGCLLLAGRANLLEHGIDVLIGRRRRIETSHQDARGT